MGKISKDALLHGLAEDYIEVIGDPDVTYGNFREKNKAALGSGGGYDSFSVGITVQQELNIDTSATEFTERPE